MNTTDFTNKIIGAFLGFIVADAMGVPAEFTTRQARDEDPIFEMRGYEVYDQPPGTWSDDSSLLLCSIQTISEGYSIQKLAHYFIEWYRTGYMSAHGEIFDIGLATRIALSNIMMKVPLLLCGGDDEYSNGNGALMRILPFAFVLRDKDFSYKLALITEVCSLTHRHPRSILACLIYVEFVINLISLDKYAAYEKTMNFISITNVFKKDFKFYHRLFSGEILVAERDEIKSTGYVVYSLESAIWSFMSTNNYDQAIVRAINLGGDTDTIGAITGGLAGVYYGFSAIPKDWLSYIVGQDKIYTVCKNYLAII